MPGALKWSRCITRTFPKLFLGDFMELVEVVAAMAPGSSFWGVILIFPGTRWLHGLCPKPATPKTFKS